MYPQMTASKTSQLAQDPLQLANATPHPPVELLRNARRVAMRELARARSCNCCESLLSHLQKCLGSTLFFDDDPHRLWASLELRDRSLLPVRILAACIALHGREREVLYSLSPAHSFPALALLAAPPTPSGHAPSDESDLLQSIQTLIHDAQLHPAIVADQRLKQALAHLWAASDALEGLAK